MKKIKEVLILKHNNVTVFMAIQMMEQILYVIVILLGNFLEDLI